MDDFVREVRWCYQDGTINRQDAIFAIKSHFLGMSNEAAEDELDGYIIASGKKFQLLTSMARAITKYIPRNIWELFPCCDGWFGDFEQPDKKLVCQFAAYPGVFYFCFGRSRGTKYSLGESKADNQWFFKSLVLHAEGLWYVREYSNSGALMPVVRQFFNSSEEDSLQSILDSFGFQLLPSNAPVNALDFC